MNEPRRVLCGPGKLAAPNSLLTAHPRALFVKSMVTIDNSLVDSCNPL